MNTRTLSLTRLRTVAGLMMLTLLAAGLAVADESVETRSSATSQGKDIQRGALTDGAIAFDEHAALLTTGNRDKTAGNKSAQKLSASAARSPNTDFWFYDATVDLFSDLDGDGYYYGIDLWFDADTVYNAADVYAVVYLSYEYGPWNEYAETATFSIFGATDSDSYAVETELVSGYPTGDYDILIELYDAYDNSFVASIGPDETSELSLLPLEDVGRDTPENTQIVVNTGGGGAFGWLAILGLLVLAVRRYE